MAPPTAIVNGAAFSCVMSCRRLYSFNLSVGNCDVPLVDGDLFSTSVLTFSRHCNLTSGLALASLDDVDEDDDGGLASERERERRENKFEICLMIFTGQIWIMMPIS